MDDLHAAIQAARAQATTERERRAAAAAAAAQETTAARPKVEAAIRDFASRARSAGIPQSKVKFRKRGLFGGETTHEKKCWVASSYAPGWDSSDMPGLYVFNDGSYHYGSPFAAWEGVPNIEWLLTRLASVLVSYEERQRAR